MSLQQIHGIALLYDTPARVSIRMARDSASNIVCLRVLVWPPSALLIRLAHSPRFPTLAEEKRAVKRLQYDQEKAQEAYYQARDERNFLMEWMDFAHAENARPPPRDEPFLPRTPLSPRPVLVRRGVR